MHYCKHTCGRKEFTLGTNRECPYSIGLTFIIMRLWSSFFVADAVLCFGHSSNNTYMCWKEDAIILTSHLIINNS